MERRSPQGQDWRPLQSRMKLDLLSLPRSFINPLVIPMAKPGMPRSYHFKSNASQPRIVGGLITPTENAMGSTI